MTSIRKKYPALVDISLTSCRGDAIARTEKYDTHSIPKYALDEERTIQNRSKSHRIIKKYFEHINKAKKILVVAGDSFSNGDELADHTIPNHPGVAYPFCCGYDTSVHCIEDTYPAPEEKTLMLNTKGEKINLVLQDNFNSRPTEHKVEAALNDYFYGSAADFKKEIVNEHLCLQRERCWVAKLQEMNPEVFVVNLSNSAQSTERSVRLILEFCFELRTHFPKKTVETILGLSFISRVETLMSNGYLNYCPTFPTPKWDPTMPMKKEGDEGIKLYDKLYINHYSDRNLVERYALALIRYFTTTDALNIQTSHTISTDGVLQDFKQQVLHGPLVDIFFRKYGVLLNNRFKPVPMLPKKLKRDTRNEKKYAIVNPSGHYTEYIHEKFAETMNNVIFNKKSCNKFADPKIELYKTQVKDFKIQGSKSSNGPVLH